MGATTSCSLIPLPSPTVELFIFSFLFYRSQQKTDYSPKTTSLWGTTKQKNFCELARGWEPDRGPCLTSLVMRELGLPVQSPSSPFWQDQRYTWSKSLLSFDMLSIHLSIY